MNHSFELIGLEVWNLLKAWVEMNFTRAKIDNSSSSRVHLTASINPNKCISYQIIGEKVPLY